MGGEYPRLRRPSAKFLWFIPAWAGNTRNCRGRGGRTTVHPRVGGEYDAQAAKAQINGGSSPRGRGIRRRSLLRLRIRRFIPAWAGNTRRAEKQSPRASVHPRVGGEYDIPFPSLLCCGGSSPRGRGILSDYVKNGLEDRFIPAWAGNTSCAPTSCCCPTVHPRVGGEYYVGVIQGSFPCGSSPRGRGIPARLDEPPGLRRFIPAWAGNTPLNPIVTSSLPVHPRVGGEYVPITVDGAHFLGSSPRGRGIRRPVIIHPLRIRFIPAWAGNTASGHALCRPSSVHPRVGGEYTATAGAGCAGSGSSPRGRGIRRAELRSALSMRFIPAWAGNTQQNQSDTSTTVVHPRVGGEYLFGGLLPQLKGGSSPRGRGILRIASARDIGRRFIPAWAGNTRR